MRSTITRKGTGSSMNEPPILTNSTSTPALRCAVSSIKAGGNDHSRPTTMPILRVALAIGSFLAAVQIQCDLLLPPGPVVRRAVPPAHGVPDALVPEHLRKIAVVLGLARVPAGHEDHVQRVAQLPQLPLVAQ